MLWPRFARFICLTVIACAIPVTFAQEPSPSIVVYRGNTRSTTDRARADRLENGILQRRGTRLKTQDTPASRGSARNSEELQNKMQQNRKTDSRKSTAKEPAQNRFPGISFGEAHSTRIDDMNKLERNRNSSILEPPIPVEAKKTDPVMGFLATASRVAPTPVPPRAATTTSGPANSIIQLAGRQTTSSMNPLRGDQMASQSQGALNQPAVSKAEYRQPAKSYAFVGPVSNTNARPPAELPPAPSQPQLQGSTDSKASRPHLETDGADALVGFATETIRPATDSSSAFLLGWPVFFSVGCSCFSVCIFAFVMWRTLTRFSPTVKLALADDVEQLLQQRYPILTLDREAHSQDSSELKPEVEVQDKAGIVADFSSVESLFGLGATFASEQKEESNREAEREAAMMKALVAENLTWRE